MNKFFLLISIILLSAGSSIAQLVVLNPFAAEQSHPELVIDRITFFGDSTVVNLTVENKLERGGWFCADKSIYLENPSTRQRYKIVKSKGIPTCPVTHSFARKGEKLSFTLVFPSIPQGTRTLNLIEDCNKACFVFKGIILDDKLNSDIRLYNQGMEHYAANRLNEAVECFIKIVENIPAFPTHVYGYSYYHLVIIHLNKGDNLTAKYWFNNLQTSSLPDKQYFIDAIRKEKGIPQ